MWIAARAALRGAVAQVHRNYHIPISNTATGVLILEPAGASSRRKPTRGKAQPGLPSTRGVSRIGA